MNYREQAEQLPDNKPHSIEKGDRVVFFNPVGSPSAYGKVIMVQDDLVGVLMEGGGYIQCQSSNWRKAPKKIVEPSKSSVEVRQEPTKGVWKRLFDWVSSMVGGARKVDDAKQDASTENTT